MAYYVYLAKCADNTYYCGYTNDLEKRITAHNNSKTGAKYTRAKRPVQLAYYEEAKTLSSALKTEYKIKQLSHKDKQKLADQFMKNNKLLRGSIK